MDEQDREEHPDRRAEGEPDRGIAQREERRSRAAGLTVVSPTASWFPNSPAMAQMCGSFTSVANANVSGGSCSIVDPVPSTFSSCQVSPPMNLIVSHATSRTTRTVRKPTSGRRRRRADALLAIG